MGISHRPNNGNIHYKSCKYCGIDYITPFIRSVACNSCKDKNVKAAVKERTGKKMDNTAGRLRKLVRESE